MVDNKQEKRKMETKLSGHKREKKVLIPPFLKIDKLAYSSWINDRLPEMLWAVLIIGDTERDNALNMFRHIAHYVKSNHDCYDVTMTGISQFPENKRKEFIEMAVTYSDGIKHALCPLLLFPDLPARKDWEEYLEPQDNEEAWQKLSKAVGETYWHQSESATDCRWIRYLCQIAGDKVRFSSSIEGIDETLRGILEYPNYGDLKHIRPSIRAGELGMDIIKEKGGSEWARKYWQYCFDETCCIPEEAINDKLKNRHNKLIEEMKAPSEHLFNGAVEIRKKIVNHFFDKIKGSAIDPRHEGAFGFALYAVTLFIEFIFYIASLPITGRIALRSMIEVYITFKCLLRREIGEPSIWYEYRSYGTGQLKLIYLKLSELKQKTSCIDLDDLDNLVNEDIWLEFTPINLGHWDSSDLRKISEEVDLKDLYDKYYSYTSGYVHANWGAVRESVFQKCVNPLHRFHRAPTYDVSLMPNITTDAVNILNGILECLSEAYPSFDERMKE